MANPGIPMSRVSIDNTLLKTLQSLNERDLEESLLVPLFHALGYDSVDRHGGPNEHGIDLVCWRKDELDEVELAVAQVKRFKPVRKSASERSFAGLLTQISQACEEQIPHANGNTYLPRTVYFITPYEVDARTLRTRFAKVCDLRQQGIKIIDGIKLVSLVRKHIPHVALTLQYRERNQILERIIHEIYRMVSSIRVTAQTLRRSYGRIAPLVVESMLSNIEDYAKLMDLFAEGIRYFTVSREERLRRYMRQHLNLADISEEIKALARPIAKSRGRDFESIHFRMDGSRVFFDPHCLTTIVFNLLANAIKYFDDATCKTFEVLVEGGLRTDYTAPKSHNHYASALVISISDWGIGVLSSEEKQIFEPGYQATRALRIDDTGQGLGLALVKMIAEDFEGEVFLEHSAKPTTFTVVIPQKV